MILLSGNKFKPLESAAAAFALKRITGVSSAIPILKARRVTAGDEVDIFDLSGTAYKTSLSGSWIESGTETFYMRKWYDQSGSGNHAEQTTPDYQPKLDFSSGYAECDFDGINDSLVTLNKIGISGNPSFSIFSKIKIFNFSGTYPTIFQSGLANLGDGIYFGKGTDTTSFFIGFYGGGSLASAIINFQYQKFIWVRQSGGNSQTGNFLFVNSTPVNTTPVLTASAVNITNTTAQIGRRYLTLETYFKCQIDSLIIYNKALTTAEIAALNNIF